MATARLRGLVAMGFAVACLQAGCGTPNRVVRYPEGALPVRYESAASHTGCLVASVAMAANYRLNETRLTEASLIRDMKADGLDESSAGDVRTFLEKKGLHLVTLSGRLDGKPPAALEWWVESRGYPVICVINRDEQGDPAFNHAVVVIGISRESGGNSADIIHYLDPSTREPLHSVEAAAFDALWARGEHAMMIVVIPLPDSQPDGSGR